MHPEPALLPRPPPQAHLPEPRLLDQPSLLVLELPPLALDPLLELVLPVRVLLLELVRLERDLLLALLPRERDPQGVPLPLELDPLLVQLLPEPARSVVKRPRSLALSVVPLLLLEVLLLPLLEAPPPVTVLRPELPSPHLSPSSVSSLGPLGFCKVSSEE